MFGIVVQVQGVSASDGLQCIRAETITGTVWNYASEGIVMMTVLLSTSQSMQANTFLFLISARTYSDKMPHTIVEKLSYRGGSKRQQLNSQCLHTGISHPTVEVRYLNFNNHLWYQA